MLSRAGKRAAQGAAALRAGSQRAMRAWLGDSDTDSDSDRPGGTGPDDTGPDGPGLRDPSLRDPGLRDPSLRDPGLRDLGLRDTGLVDTGLVDTGLSDTGLGDSGLARDPAAGGRGPDPEPRRPADQPIAGLVPGQSVPGDEAGGENGPGRTATVSPRTATAALAAVAGARGAAASGTDVPRWLRVGAAWSWRLLLLAALLYVAGKVATLLYLVIVPSAAALLLTALLQPLEARLRRAGLGALSATWCTLLLAFALLGAVVWLVTTRVEAEYPTLVSQVRRTSTQVQNWLASSPFHIRTGSLTKVSDNLVNYLTQHRSTVEGAALTGGRIVVELLAGIVLCFFISFFLIKDGARIWDWLVSGLSPERARRATLAGRASWRAVVYYVRGTAAVAAIHAVVMGITLTIIGSPLVAPLALFMFIAAFVPLAGVLIAGTVAILIVLASKGLIAAAIVLVVMVVMNQLEGHLLQPQVVGKLVRLHPLAVILVLAVAGLVAGIAGAVVAVPITAALTSAVRALRRDAGHDSPAPPGTDPGGPGAARR